MFMYENIGYKYKQEDAIFNFIINNIEYYFVLDGHGYNSNEIFIIDFLKKNNNFKNLVKLFFEKFPLNKINIVNFFIYLDNVIKKNNINSGTCLCGLIIDKNLIYLLNIGDTIFYIFKNKTCIYKSPEHNLKNENELKRIKKNNKLNNIKNGRYKKILMTRVLGDFDCKDKQNNPILPYPEIKILKKEDLIIFLTTDGIKFNYDINFIIELFIYNNDIKKYCDTINKMNLKKYSVNKVDNIAFLIKNININTNSVEPIKTKQEKKEVNNTIKTEINIKKVDGNFIYNNLKYLF